MKKKSFTRTVSIRDFRKNFTQYLKEAQEKNVHFVIMRHANPVAEVTPVSDDRSIELLIEQVAEARKDAKEGRIYTVDEMFKILG